MLKVAEGLISDVYDVFVKRFDRINHDHAVACAENLAGIASINIREHNKIGYESIQPWTDTILPSGYEKTPPIRQVSQPTLRKVEKMLDLTRVLYLTDVTPEAMFEMVNGKSIDEVDDEGKKKTKKLLCDKGIIFEDEKSGEMKSIASKSYMIDKSERLSRLWDNGLGRYWSRSHGLEIADDCNFGYLAATTPIVYGLFTRAMFIQGHLSRIDPITISKDTELPLSRIKEGFGGYCGSDTMEQMLNEDETEWLAKRLYYIIISPIRIFKLHPLAEGMWIDYELEMRKEANKLGDKDLHSSYLLKNAQKVLKRGASYALSRIAVDRYDLSQEQEIQAISPKDIELAIANQREYTEMFNLMVKQWIDYPKSESEEMRTDANIRMLLEDAFKAEPDGILSQNLCATKLGYNTDCKPVLDTIASFLREGKIVKIESDESRKLIADKVAVEGEIWCIRQEVSAKPRRITPNLYKWLK
jgi:hypothetical protein